MNKYEAWQLANLRKPARRTTDRERSTTLTLLDILQAARRATAPSTGSIRDLTALYTVRYPDINMAWSTPSTNPPRLRAEYWQEVRTRENHSDFREYLGYGQGRARTRRTYE